MMQIVEPFMKKVEFGENNVKFNEEILLLSNVFLECCVYEDIL